MSKQQLPEVGIVICNYNYGQWIQDAIKGALAQDYPAKHIFIVDDNSTDDSIEKVLKILPSEQQLEDNSAVVYSNAYSTIVKLKQNVGPSAARNVAIKKLWDRCHLFQICDADDIMLPNKVSKFVSKFIELPEVIGGVYADYCILNEFGVQSYECKEPYSLNRLSQDCIVHSGAMFSKLALQQVGLYDESLRTCEDYDLHLRISNTFMYYHIPEPLTVVRNHSQNSTNSVAKEIWEENYKRVKYNFFKRQGLIQ